MAKLLVKFQNCWADEFDVFGFEVWDADEWEAQKKEFLAVDDTYDCYFGTNEGWECEDREEWLKNYSVTPITDEEAAILEKLFYKGSFGVVPEIRSEED